MFDFRLIVPRPADGRRNRRRRLALLLRRRSPLLLDQFLLLLGDQLAALQIFFAVEIDLAFDQRHLDARVDAEGVGAEDRQIGVLADVDAADALIHLDLLGRIERDETKRLFVGQTAVLHSLRGLLVEAARKVGAVGVDRGDNALVMHYRGVAGDGVVGFYLVRPPIGEGRAARSVRGYLLGDL